jgi:hypothetical protein
MEGVEKKCISLFMAILPAVMMISSTSLFSLAAPSNRADEVARGKVVFLEKQGQRATVSVQHGLIAAKQNIEGRLNWSDASGACEQLEENGYNDWHLPNKDELNKLYLSRTLIGGFSDDRYWSSTEYDQQSALGQQFLDGSQELIPKVESLSVRPVRTF